MGWKPDLRQFAHSPKSTAVGLCVLALAAERGVHFDAAGHLAMTARDWFDVGCGVLTAVVSGLSEDAGAANAASPEQAASASSLDEAPEVGSALAARKTSE